MNTVVEAGRRHTVMIWPGKVVKIVPAEGAIGRAWWSGNSRFQDRFAANIWQDAAQIFGPFIDVAKLRIECSVGAITIEEFGESAPVPVPLVDIADKVSIRELADVAELAELLIDTPKTAQDDAINGIINALIRSEPAPTVDTLVPADNASNVDASTTDELSITFTAPVKFGAVMDIRLVVTATGTIVQRWTIEDALQGRAIIDEDAAPDDQLRLMLSAPMPDETEMHVTVAAGSVISAKYGVPFAGIANATTWNFVTIS